MYELIIGHKESGKMWDMTNDVAEVTLETYRQGQPSKLSFKIVTIKEIEVSEGDVVRFSSDGELQFYGWIFTITRDRWRGAEIICYDRLRYLKANATYAFYAQKASDIIKQIAEDLQLSVGSLANTGYKIKSLIKSNKSCIDIIQDALNQTLLGTGKIYVLYDNGKGLSLKYSGDWKSKYVLGEGSYMLDYEYKSDIDTDTYNYIKLVKPNKETGKSEVVVVKDTANIARWGMLQLLETINNDLNTAQMKAKGKEMMQYYNSVKNTFSFNALGINGLRAGMMIRVNVPDMKLDEYVLLERVTHTWRHDDHTMQIETLGRH